MKPIICFLLVLLALSGLESCKNEMEESAKVANWECPILLLNNDSIQKITYADDLLTFTIIGTSTSLQENMDKAVNEDRQKLKDMYLAMIFLNRNEALDSLMNKDFDAKIVYISKGETKYSIKIPAKEISSFKRSQETDPNYAKDVLLKVLPGIANDLNTYVSGGDFYSNGVIAENHQLVLQLGIRHGYDDIGLDDFTFEKSAKSFAADILYAPLWKAVNDGGIPIKIKVTDTEINRSVYLDMFD